MRLELSRERLFKEGRGGLEKRGDGEAALVFGATLSRRRYWGRAAVRCPDPLHRVHRAGLVGNDTDGDLSVSHTRGARAERPPARPNRRVANTGKTVVSTRGLQSFFRDGGRNEVLRSDVGWGQTDTCGERGTPGESLTEIIFLRLTEITSLQKRP